MQVALLAACKRRGIPVLCVAGAGAKADPTRLHIADLTECNVDPLARSVSARLKKGARLWFPALRVLYVAHRPGAWRALAVCLRALLPHPTASSECRVSCLNPNPILHFRIGRTAPGHGTHSRPVLCAIQVRKQLRRRHGIDTGIPVLMSTEKPRCALVDMSGGKGSLLDYQVQPGDYHLIGVPD